MSKFKFLTIEKIGVLLSIGCAVHCLTLPIFLFFMIPLSYGLLDLKDRLMLVARRKNIPKNINKNIKFLSIKKGTKINKISKSSN